MLLAHLTALATLAPSLVAFQDAAQGGVQGAQQEAPQPASEVPS